MLTYGPDRDWLKNLTPAERAKVTDRDSAGRATLLIGMMKAHSASLKVRHTVESRNLSSQHFKPSGG